MQIRSARRLVLVVAFAVFLPAQPRKLSFELNDVPPGREAEELDVIVQYAPGADPAGIAQRAKGRLKERFDETEMAVLRLSRGQLKQLEREQGVKYASPDRAVKGSTYFQHLTRAWALQLPYTPTSQTMGTGVGVAIVDSGITYTAYLANPACSASRVVYQQNFVPNETRTDDPYGHGSHVAGIAGGWGKCLITQNDGSHISGVAPGINFINLRVLNSRGAGSDSTVIKAIDRAIKIKGTYNIKVMNLSLGRPIYESFSVDPLCQAVERAWKAGITVVVAAGNSGRDNTNGTRGYGTIASPGNDPYVITVGAARAATDIVYRSDDTIASYSSKGPSAIDRIVKPDLIAPGNQVYAVLNPSTYLSGTYGANVGSITVGSEPINNNFRLSGTSMAAPVVAGGAALMLQADSTLTPDQIKARLMKTAFKGLVPAATITNGSTNFEVVHDLFTVGAGYVDLGAALANTDKIATTQRALSPRVVVQNGSVQLSYSYAAITGVNICWGANIVWGENIVWGNNVSGQSVLGGTNIVWGNSSIAGYNIVWGNSAPSSPVDPFSESLSIQGDSN